MISFSIETQFEFLKTKAASKWLSSIISNESRGEGEISIIFCNDDFLYKLNVEFLNHDTLTDVISFTIQLAMKFMERYLFLWKELEKMQWNLNRFSKQNSTGLWLTEFCIFADTKTRLLQNLI